MFRWQKEHKRSKVNNDEYILYSDEEINSDLEKSNFPTGDGDKPRKIEPINLYDQDISTEYYIFVETCEDENDHRVCPLLVFFSRIGVLT